MPGLDPTGRSIRSYICPACGLPVRLDAPRRWKAGSWFTHGGCAPECTICGEEIPQPPIGKAHTIVAWLGGPAHAHCKKEQS